MREPLFYEQKEAKLISLAGLRFAEDLSLAERNIIHDSVRPGPAPIPKDATGAPVPAASRSVRGSLLRWLLTDGEASSLIDSNGVWVMHATVPTGVDLSDCRTSFNLTFTGCVFEGPLNLGAGAFRQVFFLDCQLREYFNALNASFAESFYLFRCHCKKSVVLDNVKVGNDLTLNLTKFEDFISMTAASLGGSLALRGSKLECKNIALLLDVAQIGAEIYLLEYVHELGNRGEPFECAGDIHAPHVVVGQDIHASYAHFSKKGGKIEFDSASLKSGGAIFDHVHTDAALNFYGAKISEGISLQAARSTCAGEAVVLHEIVAGEGINLYNFEGVGSIRIDGGLIDGDFNLTDAAVGQLYLRNVHFTRDISAAKARFTSTTQSFQALDVQVDGEVDMSNAAAAGGIYFERCKIGHDLSLRGARVASAQGYSAVLLEQVLVGGGIFVSKGFDAEGDVIINGGSAGGNVSAMYARMGNFEVLQTQVGGSIVWIGVRQSRGSGLYLYHTKAASLEDDKSSWPRPGFLGVVGLRYQTLLLSETPTAKDASEFRQPADAAQSAEDRVAWLKLQGFNDVVAPQPWQELAAFFSNRGDDNSSKKVMYIAARVQGYSGGLIRRALSVPYDWVVEDPLHITLPIVGLWLTGSLIFWRARRIDAMAPREKDAYARFKAKAINDDDTPFSPLIYTLENVLPVVHFGQDEAWGPNPTNVQSPKHVGWRRLIPRLEYRWLARLRWVLIVFGWVLALILAGAIGSRFKS